MSKDSSAEKKEFTAGDVRNVTGMSYRQLNDWDHKGALPHERVNSAGWRKFTPKEVFATIVCKEIRDTFGVPIERLRFVRECMMHESADHLKVAIKWMVQGLSVMLLTDLKQTFNMDTDLEFQDLVGLGMFRADNQPAYIFLPINPLVNKLLSALEIPVLKIKESAYEARTCLRTKFMIDTPEEFKILEAIRQRKYKRVTVTKKNSNELMLEAEQEFASEEATKADLNTMITEEDFQTVTVKRQCGKNIFVKRTTPMKVKKWE
jgi:DNA-binding transcriptional MerR regulator